ncbi:MAG: Uma2 family endonuclease [Trueperaceae bacterium]
MDAVLEKLLESPKLALYLKQIEGVLEREKAARQKFYQDLRDDQKAEFINGEVIMHSPVKKRHNDCSQRLLMLLRAYVGKHSLGFIGYEKILIRLTRNDYEPDLCFFTRERSISFAPEQMFFPAPDFVVEILSDSTQERDRNTKFKDYAAHGVEEYWIIDPARLTLEQYLLENGDYNLVFKSDSGVVKSRGVEGFAIPVMALFDDVENLRVLAMILN